MSFRNRTATAARCSRRAIIAAATAALLLATGVSGALAGVDKGATYRGTNSERGAPVSFKVSSNGKKVLDFDTTLGYNGKCGQGGGPNFEVRVSSIKLAGNGSFATSATAALGPDKATIKISGHVNGKKASGSLEDPKASHCNGINAYFESFTAKAK